MPTTKVNTSIFHFLGQRFRRRFITDRLPFTFFRKNISDIYMTNPGINQASINPPSLQYNAMNSAWLAHLSTQQAIGSKPRKCLPKVPPHITYNTRLNTTPPLHAPRRDQADGWLEREFSKARLDRRLTLTPLRLI